MTQQQQTDLKIWQEDQSQPLPASLENALLEDCLDNYKDGSYTVQWFNDRCFSKLEKILFFLSRTPDGEAVMPFLDVKTDKLIDTHIIVRMDDNGVEYPDEQPIYFTLDHLLYNNFCESLRVGKSFNEAHKTINLTYLLNI